MEHLTFTQKMHKRLRKKETSQIEGNNLLRKNIALLISSSLAKDYDPLYSSSPLASLDGFSRSHGDGLYVMQLVVAATNQNALYTFRP
jgi:D-serine dehydratase